MYVSQDGTLYRITKKNYAAFIRAMADGHDPSPDAYGAKDLGPISEINNSNDARCALGEEVE